jgi:hypothetical protein
MATFTPNINLIRPDSDDVVDVSDLNQNFLKIDEQFPPDSSVKSDVLLATAWSGNTNSQLSDDDISSRDMMILSVPYTATDEQKNAFRNANIVLNRTESMSVVSVVAIAKGKVPTINIPVVLKIIRLSEGMVGGGAALGGAPDPTVPVKRISITLSATYTSKKQTISDALIGADDILTMDLSTDATTTQATAYDAAVFRTVRGSQADGSVQIEVTGVVPAITIPVFLFVQKVEVM